MFRPFKILGNSSILLKIILINILLIISFSAFTVYNNVYLKRSSENEVYQSNINHLNYLSDNMNTEFLRLNRIATSLSFDSDFISASYGRMITDQYYDYFSSIGKKISLIKNSLYYASEFCVYFPSINSVVLPSSIGSREDLDTFSYALSKSFPDFSIDSIDFNLKQEKYYIYDSFVLYVYPTSINCFILVRMDKSVFKPFLKQSGGHIENAFIISDVNNNVFSSTLEADPKNTKRIIEEIIQNNQTLVTLNGISYNTIVKHTSNNSLNYIALFPTSSLEKKLSNINNYTLLLLGFFLLANFLVIFLYYNLLKPLKKIITNFVGANTIGTKNELKLITNTFEDLREKNTTMHTYVDNLGEVLEQNSLTRLIHDEEDVDLSIIDSLNTRLMSYVVVSSVIEDEKGNKSLVSVDALESQLKNNFLLIKLMLNPKVEIYVISNHASESIEDKLKEIYENLPNKLLIYTVGISETFTDIKFIHTAFNQSMSSLLNNRVSFTATINISAFSPEDSSPSQSNKFSIEDEQELIQYVVNGNLVDVNHYFTKNLFNLAHKMSLYEFKELHHHLSSLSNKLILQHNLKTKIILNSDLLDFSNFYNASLIHNTIMNRYLDITKLFVKVVDSMYDQMLQYIEENYTLDLSLDMMADKFGITPSYVSTYFKRLSGVNFTSYLNKFRIHQAIQLMREHKNLKINELSEKVGLPNVNIFIKYFKKYTGLTPNKYKDTL